MWGVWQGDRKTGTVSSGDIGGLVGRFIDSVGECLINQCELGVGLGGEGYLSVRLRRDVAVLSQDHPYVTQWRSRCLAPTIRIYYPCWVAAVLNAFKGRLYSPQLSQRAPLPIFREG